MTARSSRPKRQPSRDERSVAGAPTVVIGCPDGARLAALKCAIETNGQFATADAWPLERALAAGRNQATAVVVLDCFPSSLALRAMAEITFARSALGVLVLGPLEPNIDALIALASGAAGYLPSGTAPTAVAHVVDTIWAGGTVLPRAVSLPLVHDVRWGVRGVVVTGVNGRAVELTNREWEALVLLRQARSTAEIARRLSVSMSTARTYIAALVHKVGVPDRRALSETGYTRARPRRDLLSAGS